MVKKILFLLLGILIILVSAIVVLVSFPKSVGNGSVSGFHLQSEHWSKTITISGDTFFVPWVTLTIDPGTKIIFDKKPDISGTDWTKFADPYIKNHNDPTGREGYNQSHFDLSAKIMAIGTKDRPIIFTSAESKPEYGDWDQLVLFGGSILDNVELAYSHNGVYIGRDGFPFDMGKSVTVKNSQFHDSLWSCIDVWSTSTTITNNEVYHCWHQAIGIKGQGESLIENNNIHDAKLSINCEDSAKPVINNNHFEAAPINTDCPQGTGNQNIERPVDTQGGTYDGKLIYPANSP